MTYCGIVEFWGSKLSSLSIFRLTLFDRSELWVKLGLNCINIHTLVLNDFKTLIAPRIFIHVLDCWRKYVGESVVKLVSIANSLIL